MDCDLLIVGSGFGGAVVALRAACAGLRVLVLERGARHSDEHVRRLAAGREPMIGISRGATTLRFASRPSPAIDVQSMRGLTGIVGCAVGGGSVHYTSVTLPPDDSVFVNGWPAGWTADSMRPHFARVAERLRPSPVVGNCATAMAIEEIGRRLNARARRVPIAVDHVAPRHPFNSIGGWRRDLVRWMQGDGATSKILLEDAYLREAESRGARVRERCTVVGVAKIADGFAVACCVGGYGVRVEKFVLRAARVVLAAGALGTVRMLLEARARGSLVGFSPRLGERFSTNGDFGALLVGPRLAMDDRPSPVATALLDYAPDDRLVLMDLGKLPVWRRTIAGVLRPILRVRDLGREGAAPMAWMIGGMNPSGRAGALRTGEQGSMVYTPAIDAGACDAQTLARLREAARAAGATLLALPTWFTRRHSITVHPLGGCAIADSPDEGVCDPAGEVFGVPGLFVADGSVIPVPLGCPPSMTIAAAAERIAERIVGAAR